VDQWGRVLEFQTNFPKEGLWWPYNGARQFELLLRNHLTQFVRRWNSVNPHSRSASSTSVPDFVEHKSPAGYQIFSSYSADIQRIVQLIVEAELRRGNSKRPGCQELFALYRATHRVLDISRQLIGLLTIPNILAQLDLLVECHSDLAGAFADFSSATENCIGQLSIFDNSLSDSIEEILGVKRIRVRFWSETLKAAAEKIKNEHLLAKIQKGDIIRDRYHYVGYEKLSLDGVVSLDDSIRLKEAAEDGQMRIEALKHLVATLSSVIKARCDFGDLFA
jgi:hypothetical protein